VLVKGPEKGAASPRFTVDTAIFAPYNIAMFHRAIVAGLGLGLTLTAGAGGAMASKPPVKSPAPLKCSTSGAKLFAPTLSPEAICARFAKAMHNAGANTTGLSIELHFLPQGVASAVVSRHIAGKAQPPVTYNMAISDRRFAPGDIDRLAASVAAAIKQPAR